MFEASLAETGEHTDIKELKGKVLRVKVKLTLTMKYFIIH